MENNKNLPIIYEEKKANAINGFVMLPIVVFLYIASIVIFCYSISKVVFDANVLIYIGIFGSILVVILNSILTKGFRLLKPNEAVVLLLFGKYAGTLGKEGYWFVNPFFSNYLFGKISLKAITLNNDMQKVNDSLGVPIQIGVVVIWKIVNCAKACFNVENYRSYISTQADAAIRQVARQYPYDINSDGEEKSLRGSSIEIAEQLKNELQKTVEISGIEIIEARISNLSYAQEIAAVMLQRQQASAVVEAKTKIVEGAVGMVKLALEKLNSDGICKLDDDKKAQIVSNLLVVLCSNKDATPVIQNKDI